MAFTAQHYKALARVMQSACPAPHWDANKRAQWEVTRSRMADMLARDNGGFKRGLFLQACEPGANVNARKVA